MIILKATTELLTITTSTLADIDYSISYVDITATTFAPSTSEGKIITASATTVLSAPAASTKRQIKYISMTNRHASTSNSVVLKKLISATDYILTPTITLLAGETVEYIDGGGWTHYLADGSTQGSYPGAAGVDSRIQFNDNNGQLGSDADFVYNKVNNHIEVGAVSGGGALALGFNANDVVSEAGKLFLYAKSIAGRTMPKWIGPSGVDNPVQTCIGFNGIKQVAPATGIAAATCMTAFATAFTNSATTYTQVAVAPGSIMNQMRSVTLATSATAGNLASHRTSQYEVCGVGGYYFMARFYVGGTIRSGQRAFHGLAGRTTVFTNVDPVTDLTTAKIGLAYSLTGTVGNWKVVASTATSVMNAIDLGSSFTVNTTDVIEFAIYCRPVSVTSPLTISYRVTNLTTPAVASGTLDSNIPLATTPLAVHHWVTNNATGAISVFGLNKWYLESDY